MPSSNPPRAAVFRVGHTAAQLSSMTVDEVEETLSRNLDVEQGVRRRDFRLAHGSVVVPSDSHRYSAARFVVTTDGSTRGARRAWVANPDLSGSGYLTVPEEVTEHVDDAVSLYKEVMDELELDFTAMHLSPSDVFLEERVPMRFSHPQKWEYGHLAVCEGLERPVKRILWNVPDKGLVLQIETKRTYTYTYEWRL